MFWEHTSNSLWEEQPNSLKPTAVLNQQTLKIPSWDWMYDEPNSSRSRFEDDFKIIEENEFQSVSDDDNDSSALDDH